MAKKYEILYVVAPLIAVVALGASLFLWYRALTIEKERITLPQPFRVSPRAFSAGLEGNLRVTLEEFGIGEKDVESRVPEPPVGDIHRIYTVRVPENVSLTLLNQKITRMVREMGGGVIRGVEGSSGRRLALTVGVGRTPTDMVILCKVRGVVAKKARVAVIIDDLGIKSVDLARRLCSLDQTVTLAILPFQRHTKEVVELAEETDTPYILHMPMEPKSKKADPGEGAIRFGDDEETVRKKLRRAFKSVAGARGLNNHMGSMVTEDVRMMEYVMRYLRENDYFFIDSRTSRASVGYRISQKSGVRGAAISGYIDVEDEQSAIEERLDELARGTFKNGFAIILGHDRPNTVEVLERKLPALEEKGVAFVKVSDLVR